MKQPRSNLIQWIRNARRRMAVARVIESIGIAVLLGCAIALLWIIACTMQHARFDRGAFWIISVSALIGMTWGLWRRPSLLQVAAQVDRQLQLDELLSTAIVFRPNVAIGAPLSIGDPDPSMSSAVAAAAELRCGQLTPRDLTVRRLGARSWSGIALAMAVVLTVAEIGSTEERRAPVGANAPRLASDSQPASRPRPLLDLAIASSGTTIFHPTDPDDPNASQFGQVDETTAEEAKPDPRRNDQGEATASSEHRAASSGTSSSRTDSPPAVASDNAEPRNRKTDERSSKAEAPSGIASGTPSRTTGSPAQVDTDGNAVSAAPQSPALPPPWEAPDWQRDVKQARQAITAGQVPASYRDLVRAYFQ